MKWQFFMPMNPPTVTHQEKDITVQKGKPVVYEPAELKAARAKLTAHLARHQPEKPIQGQGVRLIVKWLFPIQEGSGHYDGEYRITKPDTDNLQKLLKDCMTDVGFWKDDALVCSELAEKFWADTPGIFVRMEVLP